MPLLIDTHAHLDDERFQQDLPEVLQRARAAGLTRVVAVATTAQDSERYLQLARGHGPFVVATVGIQPNHVAQAGPNDWETVLRLASEPQIVALGETGLDRHWDYTPFEQQEDYFARHLALARRLGKPVVIHCRDAEADMVRMLRQDFDAHGAVRGVMHSFTGDLQTARACVDMGLHISFAGMLTYKNAQALRDVAAQTPLDRLLVETDCPYLAPVPKRGQRNEPAYVVHTAQCLAQVKGLDGESLSEQTSRNARELFRFED